MKVTDRQLSVLTLMNDGWQLGCGKTINGRVWLQQGGIGRGGNVQKVHGNTFWFLLHKKLVALDKDGFPNQTYKLTDSAIKLLAAR